MADSVILDVRDLIVSFPLKRKRDGKRLAVRAVNGVSFVLHSGQTLGIVGESGCGKSTLARALMNLIRTESGSVIYRSIDLQQLRGRALKRHRRGIQMVFQDPYASLDPKMAVGRSVTEALRAKGDLKRNVGGDLGGQAAPDAAVAGKPVSDLKARAGVLLERVGIDPQRQSARPNALSGGERQRVGIARALGADPDILICDEPTSALDVSVQAGVLNLLNELTRSLGLACIFISHDLNVVRHISDNVAVMYLGRIVECGPTEEVYRNPLHPYTRALLASAPTLASRFHPGRRIQCVDHAERCSHLRGLILSKEQSRTVEEHLSDVEAYRLLPIAAGRHGGEASGLPRRGGAAGGDGPHGRVGPGAVERVGAVA